MSSKSKKVVAVAGIIVGIVIIIIGFCVRGSRASIYEDYATSKPVIGRPIYFGADFYTEMYAVTQDVGEAINANTAAIDQNSMAIQSAYNRLAFTIYNAIGWLIVVIGAVDIVIFLYLFIASRGGDENLIPNVANSNSSSAPEPEQDSGESIKQETATNTEFKAAAKEEKAQSKIEEEVKHITEEAVKHTAEEKARQEAEEMAEKNAKREAEEKAKREAEEKAKHEAMEKAKRKAKEDPTVSWRCKCGTRFYGDTCPNCGRTLEDQ